jgi:outer membrane protein assembly factor BamB
MRRAAAASFAAALALSGCGSWDPLVAVGIKSEPAHKPTPLAPIKESVKPAVAWTVGVGKALGYRFRPAADAGKIFAANAEGAIVAIDEVTGRAGARVETKQRLSGGLTAGGGKIIAGTPKGEVIALDESGKTLWTTTVGGEIIAPAALSPKVVVVRTSDGRIFGLAAADGKRQWVFQRQTPSLLLRSEAGVLVQGNDVVAGYPNGKLIALDIEDGKLTWEVTVTLPRGTTELERIADVSGLPVIDGNNICAVAFQGKLACFEVSSRNLLWSKDLSSSLDVVRDANNIYVVDDSGKVHALARASGASVWTQDKLAYRKLTAPVVAGPYVVVGDGFGFLHVISTDSGDIVGRVATDGSAINAIIPAGSGVIVQTANGSVASIRF